VIDVMRERQTSFAVIGAAAMAVHGVARSTRDLDVLTVEARCLADTFWTALSAAGVDVQIRRGESDDPLAGVVRFRAPLRTPIDLVVGRSAWQASVIARATETDIEDTRVPVASAPDLILLKLYAGGPQDAWDIEQLLGGADRDELIRTVDARLEALPSDCRRLWTRIRGA
jgi:hypothetical protein